jgi:hypothetical protein
LGKEFAVTRPHLIAKLILAAMGIDLLMHSLGGISSAVVGFQLNCPPETFTARMLVTAAGLVITFAASLILLFRSDGLARILTGPDTGECEKADTRWIIAGVRLTMCLCGLLILYRPISYLVPAIIDSPKTLFDTVLGRQTFPLPTRTIAVILTETIKGVFGIYLIFGAEHYVRWQMRTIAAKTRGEK